MDAASLHLDIAKPVRPVVGPLALRLTTLIAPVWGAALWTAAILLAARRLAGGMETPLPPVALWAAVALAGLLAFAARGAAAGRNAAAAARWHPSVALVIFAAALSTHGTSPSGWIVAWSIVALEEFAVWRRLRRRPPLPLARTIVGEPQPEAPPLAPVAPSALSPEVIQQLTRAQTASGVDRLSGWLQTSLAAGERTAVLHVAFCPPFAEAPRIVARQSAGPPARIRLVTILPHGVRLEIKLNFSSREPQRMLLEFSAETFVND